MVMPQIISFIHVHILTTTGFFLDFMLPVNADALALVSELLRVFTSGRLKE